MTTRAAIYCRISRDPQGLRAGVERQEAECRVLTERRGWTVVDVYVDNDLSAWSGKRRPEYERMLGDIAASKVGAVVVWHLDRLTRAPKELEHFFEVCEAAQLKNMATVTGDIDLSTRDGQLQARILGAVTKKASDDASARVRAAFDAKAIRGEYKHGGERPFGYVWNESTHMLVPHPEEAALIREAVKRILAGESRRKITLDWHERGVRTSMGKPWSITRLGELLGSPRLVGLRVHRGEVIGDGDWEPIIDQETQDQIVRKMRRQHNSHRPGRQRHLLTGLAVCGSCGQRLTAKARKGRTGVGFRTYRCSTDSAASCGSCSVIAEPLEQIVLWTAWSYLRPDPGAILTDVAEASIEEPRAIQLREVLAELIEREKQLTHDHYVEGIMSRAAYLEASSAIRDKRHTAEGELDKVERLTGASQLRFTREQFLSLKGPPPSLADAQPEDVEFWRGVVQAVFERVEVRAGWRGRRFSEERVVLVPRPEYPDANRPYPAWDIPSMTPEQIAALADQAAL